MRKPGWFSLVRVAVRFTRELGTIGLQLRRIADHLDGIEPAPRPAPPDDTTVEVMEQYADHDFAHFERTAAKLAQTLGRDPTPEELNRELDGEEHGRDDVIHAWAARRPDLRGPFDR